LGVFFAGNFPRSVGLQSRMARIPGNRWLAKLRAKDGDGGDVWIAMFVRPLPYFPAPRFRWLWLLALLGLPACGGFHAGTGSSVVLPAEWKHAAGFPVASPQRDLSRWWGRFDDPTLTRMIGTVLTHNRDLATARARVRESRANRDATASVLFPELQGAMTGRSNAVRSDTSGQTSSHGYSAGLNASWEADLFGKNRTSLLAADSEVGAAEENLHTVQASLASEAAQSYLDLRLAEERMRVLQASLKSREETYQLTTWRQQAGQIDQLEMQQAKTSLEQARAAVPALEQALAQTRNRLTLLAGQTPGSLDGLLGAKGRGIPSPSTGLALGIPADAIRQRPDVRSAGHRWVAAVQRTQAARLERLPSLDLAGTLGLNSASGSKLFNPETATAGVIVGLTSPIFDGGRIRANIEAKNAAEEQAMNAYETSVLQALSDVEDALIACRRSGERLATLETAVVSAREAATLANQRYRAGVADLITVLDAQRAELSVEEGLVSARADRSTAYVQLYKALGGGWSQGS